MYISWGFDLLILAGVMGVGGSYITIKSNIEPLSSKLAGSFYGQNPYQLRNMISMRHEAIAGTIWIGFSLVLMAAGTIVSSIESFHLTVLEYLVHTLSIFGLGFLAMWATLRMIAHRSRRDYLPQMIDSHKDMFERCKRDLAKGENIEELAGNLDQIGTLIDVPRWKDEDDASYLERLKPLFVKQTD